MYTVMDLCLLKLSGKSKGILYVIHFTTDLELRQVIYNYNYTIISSHVVMIELCHTVLVLLL